MSKLFGSKAKPVTAPTAFQTRPEFAREAFKQAVEAGQAIGPEAFTPAALTEQQQAALGTLEAGLDPTSPEQFQAGLATFQDPFEEQVVQSAIRDIQEGGAGQFSDIGTMASAAGGFGGTRQALLEAELQKNIQRNIGDVSGRLRSAGFQAAADRTLGDLARTQDVAGNLFQFSDLQRQIETQGRQAPVQQANFLANLASLAPTGGGTTSFGPERKGFLGTGGQINPAILAAGATALSDERLKKNVVYLGQEDGFNVYEFEYLWSPIRYIGGMAQEILKTVPEAIIMVGDYMAVDYSKININMRLANG